MKFFFNTCKSAIAGVFAITLGQAQVADFLPHADIAERVPLTARKTSPSLTVAVNRKFF